MTFDRSRRLLLSAGLVAALAGTCRAAIPEWATIALDTSAWSYTRSEWSQAWSSKGTSGTHYWYEYIVDFRGSDLMRGVDRAGSMADWFVVYDYDASLHQQDKFAYSRIDLPTGDTTTWRTGYNPDDLLAAYWRGPDQSAYILPGYGGVFRLRLDRPLPDPDMVALRVQGYTQSGAEKWTWLRTAPEPSALALLLAPAALALARRRAQAT